MGGSKRTLFDQMAKDHEEYVKESLCPKCGDEREEITLDHNTFWVCDRCDGDHEREEEFCEPDHVIADVPPYDDLWASAESPETVFKNAVVMVPVPRELAGDVVQAVAERIWYHVDGLRDNPLDAACLADVNALVAFVKELQKLFPEVNVEF